MNNMKNEAIKIAQDSQPELYSETIEDDLIMEFEGVHIACLMCDKRIGYFERIKINLRVWRLKIEGIKCPICDQNNFYIDIVDDE